MGVGNITPNGNYPVYSGGSPYGPGVYSTLTGTTPPAGPTLPSPYPSGLSGQAAPPLIQPPSTYQPGLGGSCESNPPIGLSSQDPPTSVDSKKHKHNYIVFYATLMAYGGLISGFAGILMLPGLNKHRGRATRFTYNPDATSKNGQERKTRKLQAFDREVGQANRVQVARRYLGASDLPGMKTNSVRTEQAGKPDNLGIEKNEDIVRRYITNASSDIVHNGYWEKAHSSVLNKDIYIGFHAKDAVLMGNTVTHEGGVFSIAYAPEKAGAKNGASTDDHERLKRIISFDQYSNHVDTEQDEVLHNHQLKPIATSDDRGVHELKRLSFELPPEGAPEHLKGILQKLGINEKEFHNTLVAKNRIAPNGELHQPCHWNVQFEMQKKTPYATAGPNKRRLGQVLGRTKEYGKGALDSWKNPYDGGNRVGLMLLSSTTLTSVLAFTAASIALGMSYAKDAHDDKQNEQKSQ